MTHRTPLLLAAEVTGDLIAIGWLMLKMGNVVVRVLAHSIVHGCFHDECSRCWRRAQDKARRQEVDRLAMRRAIR